MRVEKTNDYVTWIDGLKDLSGRARILNSSYACPMRPNVKVNRHFAAGRVWALILAQTWHAAKCPVERVVRPRLEHSLTILLKGLKCSEGE